MQEKLEFVIRRLDSFEPKIDFQLAAVMSSVREVRPEPFKASHLAVWRSDNGVQLLRRDPLNDLITEIEGTCKELDDVIFVCLALATCSIRNVLRDIRLIGAGSY